MFKIYDWAGNRIGSEMFKTFEDGWSFIMGELTDELGLTEEDYQEYTVENIAERDARLLDPRDPRQRKVKS